MENFIRVTCGMQYKESDSPPEHCIICEDERQYIRSKGQRWTTLAFTIGQRGFQSMGRVG